MPGEVRALFEEESRWQRASVPVTATGYFAIEFPTESENFAFHFTGAAVAVGSVLVGAGKDDPQSRGTSVAGVTEVVDPAVLAGVHSLSRATRHLHVYVLAATPGATLHITALEGVPVPVGGGSGGGTVDVTALGGASAGLAGLPTLAVLEEGGPGLSLDTGLWDLGPTACANAAATLIAGAGATYHSFLVTGEYTSANFLYLRRVGTAAAAGIRLAGRQLPIRIPCGGTALYAYNNTGSSQDINVAVVAGVG